jgi:Putative zinc-finger
MDHETSVRLKAAERYFLGELTGEDRDGFEDHFFVCPECSEDLRALTVFSANAKAVCRQASKPPAAPAGKLLSREALWMSLALNFCLLFGLGISLLKVQPDLKRELAEARAPQFVQDVPVLGLSRGVETLREISPTTRRIVFSFYPREQFQKISYELRSESGLVYQRRVLSAPPKEDSSESHFSLSTADLKPGVYEITFSGTKDGGEALIGQSKFRVEPAR